MEVSGSSSSIASADCNNGAKKRILQEKLPHDLVMEILSWLHIKHLWPLRCVSKSWLHLLTRNPQFAKLQFDRFMEINNNHPDPIILGLPYVEEDEHYSNLVVATDFMSCDRAVLVKFPFYQPNTCYSLCGISNGLLCICSGYHDHEVYIWNPFINDYITISCLPAPSIRFPGRETATEFEFGFVQDSNVYKVVRLFDEFDYDEEFSEVHDTWRQISVYTIGVDSMWRTVQVDIRLHLPFFTFRISPLVNGCLHWHATKLGTTSWDLIVCFDLKEEVISEFLLPVGVQFQDIFELSGLLCVVDRRSEEKETHIWVMKEYGVVSSWSKQYVFGNPEGYIDFLLGITHNGGIILQGGCDDDLILYNPKTKKVVENLKGFHFASAYAFLGSIISPTAINQAGHKKKLKGRLFTCLGLSHLLLSSVYY